jgi:hypothetical protein
MFETPPFLDCPPCRAASTFGVLHIGGNEVRQRCQKCRFTAPTSLPTLDKKVIYLDQFAISNVYKIRAGETLKQSHVHDFWAEFDRRITRAQMSQAAIFPASDIHRDETIVSPFSSELRIAHEIFGGDTSLTDSNSLLINQEIAFAKAFVNGQRAPDYEYNVDDALEGHRNAWLPHLHITVTSDYSSFADGLRESRDRMHGAMRPLFESWQKERPTFEAVLHKELNEFSAERVQSALNMCGDYMNAQKQEDGEKLFNISMSSGMRNMMTMIRAFEHLGVNEEDSIPKLLQFWQWPELQKLPYHRISAYLFAATSARLASGQKKFPTPGFNNDIRAIATYAPYVDAIFVDIDCENLLSDGRLKKALKYKARVFSKNTSSGFYEYLEEIEDALPANVKKWTSFLYKPRL